MTLAFIPGGLFEDSGDEGGIGTDDRYLPEYMRLPAERAESSSGLVWTLRRWRVCGREVILHSKDAANGYKEVGAVPWDGGLMLGRCLEVNNEPASSDYGIPDVIPVAKIHCGTSRSIPRSLLSVRAKTLLELGSGLGTVGIAASLLGAHATLTDVFEPGTQVEELLRHNTRANLEEQSDLPFKPQYEVTELPWGNILMETGHNDTPKTFQFCVASDCLYREEAIGPFFTSLVAACTRDTVVLVFNQNFQEEATDEFWRLAALHFDEAVEIDPCCMAPEHRIAVENGSKWAACLLNKKIR